MFEISWSCVGWLFVKTQNLLFWNDCTTLLQILVWYILPIQAREGQTFPRVVPRAKPEGQPEEKSDLPELGLEEYHSFEYTISNWCWKVTENPYCPPLPVTVGVYCHSNWGTVWVYHSPNWGTVWVCYSMVFSVTQCEAFHGKPALFP